MKRESERIDAFLQREESRKRHASLWRIAQRRGLRRSAVNQCLSDEDQAEQRYMRDTIDILVEVRGELMGDPDYDLRAASTLWIMINRCINRARVLGEYGWTRDYAGWNSNFKRHTGKSLI